MQGGVVDPVLSRLSPRADNRIDKLSSSARRENTWVRPVRRLLLVDVNGTSNLIVSRVRYDRLRIYTRSYVFRKSQLMCVEIRNLPRLRMYIHTRSGSLIKLASTGPRWWQRRLKRILFAV